MMIPCLKTTHRGIIMLFRQFFEPETCSYTYLIASDYGREAVIIDPVKVNVHLYAKVIEELGLKLVFAMDTHTHADHITGVGDLVKATGCISAMGKYTKAECIQRRFEEDEEIAIDGVKLKAIYTPGHTSESFSFLMSDRVFTGDVLLIRGTGRTDFQNGNPEDSYDSIVNKLFTLPDQLIVYPAHDYRGMTSSSIGEEKRFNPRLYGKSKEQYVDIMNNLNLPRPKFMDEAVPANLKCGV